MDQSNDEVIRSHELYTINELMRRTKFTRSSMRSARRGGLRVYKKNKRVFVYGDDFIDYIRRQQAPNNGD